LPGPGGSFWARPIPPCCHPRAAAKSPSSGARTSANRELNFYSADDSFFLVDLPGYGYARGGNAAWSGVMRDYLHGRPNLRRVFLLVDARHGLKPNDLQVLDLLDRAAVSYQVVLTKADKIGSGARDTVAASVAAAIARRPAAFPEILATSAETGAGIPELRAAIAELAK
jgi:GTP-binding protein